MNRNDDILNLAARHGLQLKGDLTFNEMGIDFRVAFARDLADRPWVLRIPRRDTLEEQIRREGRILDLVKTHLSVSVPDWKIVAPDLIAYPLLENQPVITFDASTHEVTWNIDRTLNQFVPVLAAALCELHRIPASEAAASGARMLTSTIARQELLENIEDVKRELGMSAGLENRWLTWIDTDGYWPEFSTFVHGDLYAGHVLSDPKGNVSGIIDWSESHVGDPSIDFSGHLAVFGEESLQDLISLYRQHGGRTWEKMFEHSRERHSASPLKYAVFALRNNLDEHIKAAKSQLSAV